MPISDRPSNPPEVLTSDAALVQMVLWMRGLQVNLSRAVADLYAEADRVQRNTVTINGHVYMHYTGLIPLRDLKALTLDHATDPRFTEARKVYEAVERGDWFEINGEERAGILLNGEEVGDDGRD